MSISITKRKEACLHLLRNDFDIEGTIQWFLRRNSDDPVVQRAKYPEKLARNIITIGGSGDQQQLNLVAFQQALDLHAAEQRRQALNVLESKSNDLQERLDREQARNAELQGDYNRQVIKVQDLQDRLNNAEQVALRAALPASTEAETVAV